MKKNISIFSTANQFILDKGICGIFITILSRIPGVKSICIFNEYHLSIPSTNNPHNIPSNFKLSQATTADINSLIKLQNKKDIFNSRFSLNHFCFCVYVGNQIAGYLWAQIGSHHKEQLYGFDVFLKKHQAYYYDSYILPQFRRKGILRLLLFSLENYLRLNYHISKILTIIEVGNKVSKNAHKKIGFAKGRLRLYLKIGPFTLYH